MRCTPALRRVVSIAAFSISALILAAQTPQAPPSEGQNQASSKDAQAIEGRGLPPRATPNDYQAHAQAGPITIAAEFAGHSVPTGESTLTTEDYVVVETALFGAPDTRAKLSIDDFTLRINDKKKPLTSQPPELVFRSLRDPEWAPPEAKQAKSKTKLGSGGGDDTSSTPAPVHVPVELQRTWAQHAQRASFPQGDRTLPQAGLLFFEYRGKPQSIHSIELTYSGPTGKAVLTLTP